MLIGIHIALNTAPFTANIIELVPLVDVLIVNQVEFQQLSHQLLHGSEKSGHYKVHEGSEYHQCHLEEHLRDLHSYLHQLKLLVLTLGSKGVAVSLLREDGGSCVVQRPAHKATVKDTTAAGDTFVGFFLATLFKSSEPFIEKNVLGALEVAVVAAALACEVEGAMVSIPTLAAVEARRSNT